MTGTGDNNDFVRPIRGDATRVEEAAAAWRARQERADWSERDQAELNAWLARDTAHRVAWLRIDYGWNKAGRLSALRSPRRLADALSREPSELPRQSFTWRSTAVAATVALAVALGVFGVPDLLLPGGNGNYVTDVGGFRTVALRDGSRVELNTDTRLRVAMDEQTRNIHLERGEAYFDVAHDAQRPFVVHAGDQRVVALGTRFSVRNNGRRVEVVVEQGKVKVEPAAIASIPTPKPPTIALPGDRVVAEAGAVLVAEVPPRELETELSWRHGFIVFEKASLAEAAAELNRYNAKKLVIRDPAIADTRISGSIEPTNMNAFARLLRTAYGFQVLEQNHQVVVLN